MIPSNCHSILKVFFCFCFFWMLANKFICLAKLNKVAKSVTSWQIMMFQIIAKGISDAYSLPELWLVYPQFTYCLNTHWNYIFNAVQCIAKRKILCEYFCSANYSNFENDHMIYDKKWFCIFIIYSLSTASAESNGALCGFCKILDFCSFCADFFAVVFIEFDLETQKEALSPNLCLSFLEEIKQIKTCLLIISWIQSESNYQHF